MALEDSAKINLALKKIQGKAQTSNQKDVYNESLGSNVSIGADTIFGESIPAYASSSFYEDLNSDFQVIMRPTPQIQKREQETLSTIKS
ncbi:MAG: hypothetical protein ACXACD_21925 [Candidatus Thorarchaeota archaeon]|jgi:hypothetical protein